MFMHALRHLCRGSFTTPGLLVVVLAAAQTAGVTLVDFNGSESQAVFGQAGWSQILRDPAATQFVNPDGNPEHAGIAPLATATAGAAYAGVAGSAALDFQRGQRVIATFFNRSSAEISLRARVSFTDANAALPVDTSASWHSMYYDSGDGYVKAGQLRTLEFCISDSTMRNALSAPVAQGSHTLVNLGFIANSADLILTKIELTDDADTTRPSAPQDLRAELQSVTAGCAQAVKLTWKAATDAGSGISRYLIYRNGALYMAVTAPSVRYFAQTNQDPYFVDLMVTPAATYSYEVSAMDNMPFGMYPTTAHLHTRRGNESGHSNAAQITTPQWSCDSLINLHGQLAYQGAIRLPTSSQEYLTWAYGGSGFTYFPNGNPGHDTTAELQGSLFGFGHGHGMLVGELSIPRPSTSRDAGQLPRSRQLKDFTDIWPRVYPASNGSELQPFPDGAGGPDVGMAYHPAVDDVAEGLYYVLADGYATPSDQPNLGCFSVALDRAFGPWFIGNLPPGNVDPALSSRFVFTLPPAWAEQHTGGRTLVVGSKYISGRNVPSQGTTFYAVAPWESGGLPAAQGSVSTIEMLRYPSGSDPSHSQLNYFWDDDAEGAAFISDGARSAFLVAYRQSMGDNWYGDPYGQQNALYDLPEPRWASGKGTCATYRVAAFLIYNPADIAAVINGAKQSWEPQPYAMMDLTAFEMHQNGMGGAGSLAWDAQSRRLFLLDINGDPAGNGQPLIQVFGVADTAISAGTLKSMSPATRSVPLVKDINGRRIRIALPQGRFTLEVFNCSGSRVCHRKDVRGPLMQTLELPAAGLFIVRIQQSAPGGHAHLVKAIAVR